MNAELALAIEELQTRPLDSAWLIPVLIDACDLPKRPIGSGRTLADIQHVALFPDWNSGVAQLVQTLLEDDPVDAQMFEGALASITTWQNRSAPTQMKTAEFTIAITAHGGVGKSVIVGALIPGSTADLSRDVTYSNVPRYWHWNGVGRLLDIPAIGHNYGQDLDIHAI